MKNFLKLIIILLGIIAFFYFFKEKFSAHNLKKSIAACVVAQQRTLET